MTNTACKNVAPLYGTYSLTPAEQWEFGHMAGNGEMGIIHYGPPGKEKVIVNHAELFLPLGTKMDIPDMAPYLEEIRNISHTKSYIAAHDYFIQKGEELGHTIVDTDPFHPGFTLVVENEESEHAEDYSRSVDFASGELCSSFQYGDQHETRRLFVSRTSGTAVMSISSSRPMRSMKLSIEEINHPLLQMEYRSEKNQWIGTYSYKYGGGYKSRIQIEHNGSEMDFSNEEAVIKKADHILIKMTICPFSSPGRPIGEGSYETLFQAHKAEHESLFFKAKIDLNGGERRRWSGEELLEEIKQTGQLHPAVVEKLFDAGRYMFLSSTGVRPPNLQGIWTGTWKPSWSSDYTLDTNLQLAMAAVFSGNMLHGMEPFTALLKNYMEDFKYNARQLFGCRGILTGVRSSTHGKHLHWGDSSWGNRECDTFFGAFWTCGAGWLAHWLYDYYVYTGDRAFLENDALPFMKETALFYEDFLIEDRDGRYTFLPSYSAENGIAANSTQDIAVAKELLGHLIEGCKELGIDAEMIPKWTAMLDKMPPYLLNEEGILKEWAVEDHDENYDHRHFSHLYPLFQSYEFSPEETPALWEAAEKALRKKMVHWLYNPNTDTSSHGRMHAGLCAVRLGMADTAADIIRMMAAGGAIYPSFMTAHYDDHNVFNVDANGCFPELIHNMFVFSRPGELELLPALPKELEKGSIRGTLCRGQIQISLLEWDIALSCITLKAVSGKDQLLTIVMKKEGWKLDEEEGPRWVVPMKKGKPVQLKWRR